jgi:hypothetical protein
MKILRSPDVDEVTLAIVARPSGCRACVHAGILLRTSIQIEEQLSYRSTISRPRFRRRTDLAGDFAVLMDVIFQPETKRFSPASERQPSMEFTDARGLVCRDPPRYVVAGRSVAASAFRRSGHVPGCVPERKSNGETKGHVPEQGAHPRPNQHICKEVHPDDHAGDCYVRRENQ